MLLKLISQNNFCWLKNPLEDGGQWDMLVNIITKYGLMPKKNFPESFSCEASNTLNTILHSKVIYHQIGNLEK